jgi:hypothetical protein
MRRVCHQAVDGRLHPKPSAIEEGEPCKKRKQSVESSANEQAAYRDKADRNRCRSDKQLQFISTKDLQYVNDGILHFSSQSFELSFWMICF